jgi:hypothetical protein
MTFTLKVEKKKEICGQGKKIPIQVRNFSADNVYFYYIFFPYELLEQSLKNFPSQNKF